MRGTTPTMENEVKKEEAQLTGNRDYVVVYKGEGFQKSGMPSWSSLQ